MPEPSSDPCPTCGAELLPGSPGGLCSPCLATSLLTPDLPSKPASPPATVPARIPGFELLERIGEGGFGVVYAARQLRPTRRVAIKILKHGFDHPEALARFEAERQALALMDHTGIAHVYDAGETADGQPYFVMELIDGVAVTTHADSHALTLTQRLSLFTSVCAAVAHAHRRGVIHRDLKPSNVLVPAPPANPTPKIIDFGIAKATESLLTDRTLLTRGGQALGTPSHMSPEQAAGTGVVDTRSDIYSLGVILYELVTSTQPFRAQGLAGLPHDEVLKKIRTETPPLPSARLRESSPRRDRDPLLHDIDWIVLRSIEKDPDRRYPTADALAADIDRCLAGAAVHARPPSTAYRLGKFVRKNRVPVFAAVAVAAALIVATAVSLTMFLRAGESDLRGRQRFSHADFTHAASLVDERPAIAVAHLARALRTNPHNHAATSLLLNTLADQDWPARGFPPFDHGSLVRALAFSADGSHLLVTGDRNHLDIIDSSTGTPISSVPLEGNGDSLSLSPDGRYVAIVMHRDGMALVDLQTSSVVTSVTGTPALGGNATWSADSSLLAIALDGQPVRIWDIANRSFTTEIATTGHQSRASFLPRSSNLAVAGGDTLQLFDPRTATPVSPIFRQPSEIIGFRLTPDATRVVIHGRDNSIVVRDLATTAVLHRIDNGTFIESFEISPDGGILVTGSTAGVARIWNLNTGTPVGEPVRHEGAVTQICFSPDATLVATGSKIERLGAAAVQVWDALTGTPVSAPIYHPRGAGALAFHPGGSRIAVGSRSRLAAVWQLQRNSMLPRRIHHPDPVWRITFDPSTGRALTITTNGVAHAWDPRDGTPVAPPETTGPLAVAAHASSLHHGFSHSRPSRWPRSSLSSIASCLAPQFRSGGVFAAAASADGTLLATGSTDGYVRLWSLESGEPLQTLDTGGQPVYSIAITPDASSVAAGTAHGNVIVWDIPAGARTAALHLHGTSVITLTFSPSGSHLASGSADRTARITRLHPAPPSPSPPLPHRGQVSQLAFSPDGRTLATSGDANTAHLWATASAHPICPPLVHIDIAPPHGIFLLWNNTGDRLITTGSHDDSAHFWDSSSGGRLAKPMLLPSGTRAVSLHPDSNTLLTAGDHHEARLWDLGSAEPLTPLIFHDGRVSASAFDKIGHFLATATVAGTLYIRDLPDPTTVLFEPQLAYAESLAGFRFNPGGILEETPTSPSPPPSTADPWFNWLAHHSTTSPYSTLASDPDLPARESLLRNPSDPDSTKKLADHLLGNRDPTSHAHSLGRFLAASAPPGPQRPTGISPDFIDLAPLHNAPLHRDPITPGTGNSLVQLPPGTHHLAGVNFDIRALVVLSSQRVHAPFPASLAIKIDRPCSRIHFLHGALHAVDPPGTTIGSYTFHYADGSSATTDLVTGENIRDWWHQSDSEIPLDLVDAPLAWKGTNPLIGDRQISLCLHRLTIENTNPQSPVTEITFSSANAQGAPFLVAMTVVPPSDPLPSELR